MKIVMERFSNPINNNLVHIPKVFIILRLLLGASFLILPSHFACADNQFERINQSKAIAHYIMAVNYDLHEMSSEAISEYETVILLDPGSFAARLRLGAHYAKQGRSGEAINQLVLVSVLDPGNIQSHYLLALIYSTQKKFDKAAAQYEIILSSLTKTDPENMDVYFYLGQLYYSQHQYEKSIIQFEKILAIEPKNTEIMYFLGSLYLEVDKRNQAIEVFKKAIEIDPEHDGVLNSLGYVYAEQGSNLDEALRFASRAIAIVPNNGAYFDTLGWVYFKKGNYSEALKILLQADAKIKDPVIYEHLGDVYCALDQQAEAIKYWNKSLAMQSNQKRILEKLSRLEKNQLKSEAQHP